MAGTSSRESGRSGPTAARTVRNAAALGSAEILGKVGTLAYTLVAARVLATEEFGAFAFALAVGMLVQPVAEWGLSAQLIRQTSRRPEQLDRVLAEHLGFKLFSGVLVFGATGLVMASGRPSRDAVVVLLVMLLACLVDMLTSTVRNAAEARQDNVGVAVAHVSDRLLTALLAVAALLLGGGAVGLGVAYLTGSVVGLLMALRAVYRLGVRVGVREARLRGVLFAGRVSWILGLSTIVSMALFRLDTVLIEWLLNDVAVANYVVAYRLVETVLFLTWSISRALYPVVAGVRDSGRMRRAVRDGVGAVGIVYVGFLVVALVEPRESIALLFGQRYVEAAAPVLRWLAPAPLLFAVGHFLTMVLEADDRDSTPLWTSLMATGANAIGNLLLIPVVGIVGAAIMTSASLLLEALALFVVVTRLHGAPRLDRALVDSIVAGLVMAAATVVLQAPVLVEIAVGGAAYLATWYAVARRTAPDRVALARSTVRRLLPG